MHVQDVKQQHPAAAAVLDLCFVVILERNLGTSDTEALQFPFVFLKSLIHSTRDLTLNNGTRPIWTIPTRPTLGYATALQLLLHHIATMT